MDDKHLAVGSLCPYPEMGNLLSPRISFFLRANFSFFLKPEKHAFNTHTKDFCGKKWP
jgi:hypothetical protein